MKILFILSAFPKLSETFVLNQITGLIDLGYDVEIFAEYNPGEGKTHEAVSGYGLMDKTYYIPRNKILRLIETGKVVAKNLHRDPMMILKSLNAFRFGKMALNLRLVNLVIPCIGKKYDIIHSHFGPNGSFAIFLRHLGIRSKFITTFHGYDANSYPRLYGGLECYRDLFASGDMFIANSSFTRNRLIELGCEEEKIMILPVGFHIDRFKFATRGVRDGEPVNILTIGRLVEKKGHEYMIRALSMLKDTGREFRYFVAGDGPLRGALESIADELGLGGKVMFLGPVDEGEAHQLYSKAHVFALPSVTAKDEDREGQALVLQEAQACGLPVLSTFHNGIPEGMLDGESGFLVPEKSPEALAERLKFLIDRPDIWPELGKKGRAFVEKKYDIRILNGKMNDIYLSVIKNRGGVP